MTTLHETAYPSLKPDPTPRELAELYTPTEEEQLLAAGVGKRALPRMAALIHLKIFQRLGYFIPLLGLFTVLAHIHAMTSASVPPADFGSCTFGNRFPILFFASTPIHRPYRLMSSANPATPTQSV